MAKFELEKEDRCGLQGVGRQVFTPHGCASITHDLHSFFLNANVVKVWLAMGRPSRRGLPGVALERSESGGSWMCHLNAVGAIGQTRWATVDYEWATAAWSAPSCVPQAPLCHQGLL